MLLRRLNLQYNFCLVLRCFSRHSAVEYIILIQVSTLLTQAFIKLHIFDGYRVSYQLIKCYKV
jgi:hypothetical protein